MSYTKLHLYLCLFLVFCGLAKAVGIYHRPGRQATVCEHESYTATCPANTNIVIKEAIFGHIGLSRCVEVDTGYFGCKVNVLNLLDIRCSGKQECEIPENDPQIRHLNPCRKGLDVFLEISYICISAKKLNPCQQNTITSQTSYISSTQSTQGHCNSDSPISGTQFFLVAKKGQKIKLSTLALSSSGGPGNATKLVGHVVDEGEDKVHPMEINVRRTDLVPFMVSKSNEVIVSIHGGEHVHFLLFLEAIGCEDLEEPKGHMMNVERDGDQTTVRCLNSPKSWRLTCVGVHWAGVIGNCSQVTEPEMEAVVLQSVYKLALPKDVILMVIVGVTLVLALVITTVGYVCYKRTLPPLDPPTKPEITVNNLKAPNFPALPEKRGSTLLRQLPNQATLLRPQPIPSDSVWEPPVPLPPPRRDNTRSDSILTGSVLETVPLRSGDMILESGTETILVRGDGVHGL